MSMSVRGASVLATFLAVVLTSMPVTAVLSGSAEAASVSVPQTTRGTSRGPRIPGGRVSPVVASDIPTPNIVFSNPAPITINSSFPGQPADPYPSDITVSGLTRDIASVTLTLTGFGHEFPADLAMLLVAPNGADYVFWAGVGGNVPVTGLNITVDDAAVTRLPNGGLSAGSFRPAEHDPIDMFPTPAPTPPYGHAAPFGTQTLTSVFGGLTPAQANGTWSLYIVDRASTDTGSISGGWSLDITQETSLEFSNPAPITINELGEAKPYPSNITVSGLTRNIASMTLTLTGFSHTFPSDVDMLLVAPNGAAYVFWSDPSNFPVNADFTLDDNATSLLPASGLFIGGTYRPTSYSTDPPDTFPGPAPTPPYNQAATTGAATFTSVFGGLTPAQANGTWSLYVVDDTFGDFGSISGGWSLNITEEGTPPTAGQIIISEFRLRGFALPTDEFIELYNNSGADITVSALTGTGLGVAASDGVTRCTVPNGTLIPAAGHYLCVNSVGYSLAAYPAGNGTTATGDATYTTDIPDNAGIALFNNNTGGASYSLANRLDAVGSTSEANTVYKEGTGYPALGPGPGPGPGPLGTIGFEGSFFRNLRSGLPQDTDNNFASGTAEPPGATPQNDFVYANTSGSPTPAGTRLGAPGPENLSSPIQRNTTIKASLVSPCVSSTAPPNRVRTGSGNSGTLEWRRKFTNNTGSPVTRLRFRIVDTTTLLAPAGVADLRAVTSASSNSDAQPCGGGTVALEGLTLETPPTQSIGGGFNSSLSAGTITLGTPIAPGSTINVKFLLNIMQAGNFRFFVNVEALP